MKRALQIAAMVGLFMTIGGKSSELIANPFDQFDTKPSLFSGPAKLIVSWNQGITAVAYPSQGRCEEARRFVEAEVQRQSRIGAAMLPPGSIQLTPPTNGAFCIPG